MYADGAEGVPENIIDIIGLIVIAYGGYNIITSLNNIREELLVTKDELEARKAQVTELTRVVETQRVHMDTLQTQLWAADLGPSRVIH